MCQLLPCILLGVVFGHLGLSKNTPEMKRKQLYNCDTKVLKKKTNIAYNCAVAIFFLHSLLLSY